MKAARIHKPQGLEGIDGLVYEDAPASIRGPAQTVVLDYRVLNLELASKELDRRVAALEAQISAIQAARVKGVKNR